ncbi:hypothetical protein TYRP_023725 [Tyrophagus putrescentiae]|nr:hypothetical protein TYRP_023725 [Tyrophagus putrescentiae]
MLLNRVWLCVFLCLFGLISSELQEITPDTGLTGLHDELRELLTEEEWNAFSDRYYYAEYDLLDGLNVNSVRTFSMIIYLN